jgi:hypothetical protein
MPHASASRHANPTAVPIAPAIDLAQASSAALRRELLSSIARRCPLALPAPALASRHQTIAVRDYLAWWVTHPNPVGAFAARTRWLRRLPASWLVKTMFALGYDGLVYLDGGAVVGHVFFQRRGPDLHGFSTAVSPPFEGSGYSVVMMLDFVSYGARCPGIARARIGRGANNVTLRFTERLKARERELGWTVEADGWVRFAPPVA